MLLLFHYQEIYMIFADKTKKKDIIFSLFIILLSTVIILLPTTPKPRTAGNSSRARAEVISTDNSELEQYGIVKTGNQQVELRILNGRFRGMEVSSTNILMGKLELDKMFVPGDKALMVIDMDENNNFVYANIIDHYRINVELILLLLFVLILIAYAGWTGFNAVLSFTFTGIVIWKILIPGFLSGINPVLISFGTVIILSAAIIFLIGGFSKKGLTAFTGTIAGILFTSLFSMIFGHAFHVHGAVKPFSETLLYSGYAYLDLNLIFLSGIFIASSGAVMDIAMDIAASMHEIKHKRPDISFRELLKSGFKVGRSVIGTMTTTLLLAYSGGFTALLMVFMAQGTPLMNILNLSYVSAEILHTLVGSFGLVLVAPLTAITGALIFSKKDKGAYDITSELSGSDAPASLSAKESADKVPALSGVSQ